MNIYTKNGDQGNSTLINGKQIPKYDERFHLLGSIDELTSQIGMVKIKSDHRLQANLTHIQKLLMTIMASVADTTNPDYLLDETEVTWLEQQIDQIEQSFPRKKEFILPGETELSTRLDVARTVCLCCSNRYGCRPGSDFEGYPRSRGISRSVTHHRLRSVYQPRFEGHREIKNLFEFLIRLEFLSKRL